jgi:hypothetical protein
MAKVVFEKNEWISTRAKSEEQVSLVKLTPPWFRFNEVMRGRGGYVAGNTKSSGDWDREGHIKSPSKYRMETILPANKRNDKY